jgi:4,5-dihydroxyphthalate decarboxylase
MAWFRPPVEEQRTILGDDPWPYGLEKNRHVVGTLMNYLYEQGLAKERLKVEDLFAPNTLDL